jgi:uncharacterized membrane protein YGL010W
LQFAQNKGQRLAAQTSEIMTKKPADQWFSEYGESHNNRLNKALHWICVPLIAVSVIALFWEIPTPELMRRVPFLNWATLLVAGSLIFYLRLSPPLAIGMLILSTAVICGIAAYERMEVTPIWQVALLVFLIAWIGQFIGHYRHFLGSCERSLIVAAKQQELAILPAAHPGHAHIVQIGTQWNLVLSALVGRAESCQKLRLMTL